MTKVLFHGSIEGFRRRIGNLIFRRLPDGTKALAEAWDLAGHSGRFDI